MIENRYKKIARIIGVHGIKGEIKIYSYYRNLDFLKKVECLYVGDDVHRFTLSYFKNYKKDFYRASFQEVSDRNRALSLLKKDIYIEDIFDFGKENFSFDELIYYKIFDVEGVYLGSVENFFENGAHGVCEVAGTDNNFMFPYVEEVVKNIDKNKKEIIVDLPQGLIELYSTIK